MLKNLRETADFGGRVIAEVSTNPNWKFPIPQRTIPEETRNVEGNN